MYETNQRIRERAMLILSELKTEEARSIIEQQFTQRLQENELPSSVLIAAMMYYGVNPWPSLVPIVEQGECDIESAAGRVFPLSLIVIALNALKEMLMAETKPDNAVKISCLLRSQFFEDKSLSILIEAKQHHSVQEVRKAIPEITVNRYRSFHH